MNIYSQKDPLWAKRKIGQTGYFIETFGCTLTCVAMVASYFKDFLTPLDIATRCKYTNDARIIWQSVDFKNFTFDGRYYSENREMIDECIKNPDRAVILQVNKGKHWVVATGKTFFMDKYKIADPLDGVLTTLSRYQNTINGFATFIRKQSV